MKISFVSPEAGLYSETFIKNLKEGLPGKIYHCYGGLVPTKFDGKVFSNTYGVIPRVLKRAGLLKFSSKEYSYRNFLRRNKIDLVIANYGTVGSSISTITADLDIPLIVHFHGYDASVKQLIERYKNKYSAMFKIARAIVVVSEEMRMDLIALGAPPVKIHGITYAPSAAYLGVLKYGQPTQVLSVGRFVEKKAPYLTILAFRIAQLEIPELKLKLVGEGPLLQLCKDLVAALKVDNVEFTGVLQNTMIAKELSNSFCFVQHSKTASDGDKEGTPVAILEALASGTPVVSTYHAGIPDVVKEGVNGFLVDPGDVEAMGNRIIRLFNDKLMAKSFGQSGKQLVQEHYSEEKYFLKWNALIEQVMKEASLRTKESNFSLPSKS
jgi:colanic acid/amylovoran biosynthesis glycosyltransferase